MRIGVAFDLIPGHDRSSDPGPDDRFEEFDKPETVEAIASVLRGEGHEVVLLGDGPSLLRRVLEDPPDFVWNLAEGEGTGRCREARVPAVLEMLGIPFSGSDPLTLGLALDKELAKKLVRTEGCTVPDGVALDLGFEEPQARARLDDLVRRVGFPLILKPALEGSSKGIHGSSLVESVDRALALASSIGTDYAQAVLIEEFVAGDELTVGLIGNGSEVEVLGIMKVVPRIKSQRFVYSIEVKRDWARRVSYETPAQLEEIARLRVEQAAELVYRTLGCRDVARIDFRLRDAVPYFLEANPLPGLAPGSSDLVLLAQGVGLSHAELITKILHASLSRTGLGHYKQAIRSS